LFWERSCGGVRSKPGGQSTLLIGPTAFANNIPDLFEEIRVVLLQYLDVLREFVRNTSTDTRGRLIPSVIAMFSRNLFSFRLCE